MNTRILIASAGSLALTAAASAAFQVTQSNATWASGTSAIPVTYTDPGSIANTSGSGLSWTGGDGWEAFALTTTGNSGAVTLTGSSPSVTAINFAASSTFAFTQFQFDFVGSEQIWGPQGTDGIYSVGFNISFTPGPDTAGVTVTVNGVHNLVVNGAATGFVGVYAGAIGDGRIDTISFSLSSGQSAIVTGFTVGVIPAPGAIALLGAAGLISRRRR